MSNHPREVIEAALAHVVQNRVEAAYRRTDLLDRRRRLMDDWAAYLASEGREQEAGPTRVTIDGPISLKQPDLAGVLFL